MDLTTTFASVVTVVTACVVVDAMGFGPFPAPVSHEQRRKR